MPVSTNGVSCSEQIQAAIELWDNRRNHSTGVLRTKRAIARQHVMDLRKSGLTDETICRCKFYSVEGDESGQLLNWKSGGGQLGPCLVIPFLDRDGTDTGFARLRPDCPLPDKKKPDKVRKYEQPKGKPVRVYFPPAVWPLIDDITHPLVITEGEKKAAAAAQCGFGCVGLAGVSGWSIARPRDAKGKPIGERNLLPDLSRLPLQGREVVIIFDSDSATNPRVAGEEQALSRVLMASGAAVKVVRLLPGPDGAKVGLDDYLAANQASALRAHIAMTPVYSPGPHGGSVSSVSSVKCRVDTIVPKDLRPFVPFPTRALPHPLVCVVEEGAAAIGCDPTYIALPVLSVVAGAIGNSRSIQLKRGWYEPSIVWTGVIGDSGTLKSPAYRYALAPAYAVQRRFRQQYGKARSQYEAENEGVAKGDRPPPPTLRRAYCSDCTIEKLAQILEDNPKGILVARDELSGWLGSFTKYKAKGAGSDMPNWLELFTAGCLTVDRKTGDRTHVAVEHASASVVGGIQPGVLARILSGDHFDSGLVARMLLAWPPRRTKEWSEAEASDETTEAYEQLVDRLYALTLRQTDESRFVPHRRKLSADAKDIWIGFYQEFAREQANAEGDIAASLSKLEGYAARFALLHHVVTHVGFDVDDDRDIGRVSVEAGIGLARWFANETRRVYAALTESDTEKLTRRVIEWIRSRGDGGVTARELQRSNPSRYRRSEDAEAVLTTLADAGIGCWTNRPTTDRGGCPTRTFRLNPTLDKTDTTPDDEMAF